MSAKKDVVNWKEQLAAEAQAVASQERPQTSVISLRGGAISYNGDVVPELSVVVLAASYERTYYDRPFDPDDQSPPACFAQSMDENLLAPHENVAEPQATNCHECPLSQWGSDKSGSGKGQACKIRRKLALLPYPSSDYAEAEMATMNVPPTSGRYYSSYANKLASTAHLPPWAAGTKITTQLDPKTQFKVNFEAIQPLDEGDLPTVHGRIIAAEQLLLTPYAAATDEEGDDGGDKY